MLSWLQRSRFAFSCLVNGNSLGEYAAAVFLRKEGRVDITLNDGSVCYGDGGSVYVAEHDGVALELSLAADLELTADPAVNVGILGAEVADKYCVAVHAHLALEVKIALHRCGVHVSVVALDIAYHLAGHLDITGGLNVALYIAIDLHICEASYVTVDYGVAGDDRNLIGVAGSVDRLPRRRGRHRRNISVTAAEPP